MPKNHTVTILFLGLLMVCAVVSAVELVPSPEAVEAIREYERACSEEKGTLWGVSLCGPILVVDPASRIATANVADAGGLLHGVENLFIGVLPEEVGLANTALEWSGTKWSMVLLPLPEDEMARSELMLHEAWHRLQDDLSLPARSCNNNHLENTRARIWMRLEWRALARALQQEDQRLDALADALLFRAYRHHLFPDSAHQEVCLEMHEGLAEYTGLRAAYGSDAIDQFIQRLATADGKENLARSFAYVSGPAYGLLLDGLSPGWRGRLGLESDLAQLAAQTLPAWSPDFSQVETRAAPFGYQVVRDQEEQLEKCRAQRQAFLRDQLVDDPGLVLPLEAMKMEFNPNQVVGLAPHGTVYLTLTIRDSWGRLEARECALIAADFRSVAVPGHPIAVDEGIIDGDSWRLELKNGWRLVEVDEGPATIKQEPPTTIHHAPVRNERPTSRKEQR